MTHTLESLRFNYYENTLDAEDFMHIIIDLQDELAEMTADRDSESRWATQYLRQRDEARAEVEQLRDRVADLEQFAKKVLGDITGAEDDLSQAKISLRIALKGGEK